MSIKEKKSLYLQMASASLESEHSALHLPVLPNCYAFCGPDFKTEFQLLIYSKVLSLLLTPCTWC